MSEQVSNLDLRIGQLAERAGVGVETVRYYQRIGLLPVPGKPPGGTRRYEATHLQRLLFIRRAQSLGFSLDDIRLLIDLGDEHCGDVEAIAVAKLTDVRHKIAALRKMERALATTVEQCRRTPDAARCPIIHSIADGDD